MTIKELGDLLATTNLPVAYGDFPEEECPEMPFIVFQETRTNNFMADGQSYKKIRRMQIDLYTKEKDEAIEALVEEALSDIAWNITMEQFQEDEQCLRTIYELEI